MFTILIVLKYLVLALCTIDNTILNILCGLRFIRLPWFWILTLLKQQKRLSHKLRCVWIRATWKHNVIFYLLWIICWLTEKIQDSSLWVYGYVDQCIFALSQSSTVLRCPRGEMLPRLCRTHSEDSTTLPQHDQWGLPGCALWPCPQPWNPPECAHTHTEKFILGENILFY